MTDHSKTPPTPGAARSVRYVGRAALRTVTTVMRCYDCGREPTATAVGIRQTPEGVVGYAGLVSCGRVWLCPVCNAKVMARRAVEIGAALTWASVQGYHIIWGSLTVRHNAVSHLQTLIDIQRSAWRFAVSAREWRDQSATSTVAHQHSDDCAYTCERKRDTILNRPAASGDRVGYIRAAELTIGGNGWHPHFHPLVIYRGTRAQAQSAAELLEALWVEGVDEAGGEALRNGAQQLRVVSGVEVYDALAGYVTKSTYDGAGLALETVWSQGKIGRGRVAETVSHWTLLVGIQQGLADPAGRWSELEEATAGHRMITWSRGLRAFAGVGTESSDEEVAAAEAGTRDDTVCYISTQGWSDIRDRPELLADILTVLEVGGWEALRPFLDQHQVEYFTLVTSPEMAQG